jgi:hypothetical protein
MGEDAPDQDPPPEVRAALDRLHAQRHAAATVDLVDALRSADVDLIVLKGVGTAALLASEEPRVSADIDLLVRPGHGRRTARVLRRRGYHRETVAPHASSWASATDTPVDVHVTLPRASVGPRRLWAALDAHRTEVLAGEPPSPVPVLDPSAAALHLAVHATQAAAGDREPRELAMALDLLDDGTWAQAAQLARSLGLDATLSWALDQVDGGGARRVALFLPPVGPDDVPARSLRERGAAAFLRSSVHPVERGRSLLAEPARRFRRRVAGDR